MNKKNFLIFLAFLVSFSSSLFAQSDSNISDKELMNQMEKARSTQGKDFSKEWSETVPSITERENLKKNPSDTVIDPFAQFSKGNMKSFMFEGGDMDSLMRQLQLGMKGFDFGGNDGNQNFNLFNFGKMFGGSDTSQQNFQGFSFDGKNMKPLGNMDTATLNQFRKQMEGFSQNFQMPNNLMEQMQKSFGGMGLGGFPNSKDNRQFGKKESQSDKQNGKKKSYNTESF